MSQVQHRHHHASSHGHGHKSKAKRPPAPITNFAQQAMDQQMAIIQMKQAQLIQQFTAQIAGLQYPQLSPEQQQAAAQQQQAAALRQQQFDAWNAQQVAALEQSNLAIQQNFQRGMQGLGNLETALGGFLNMSYASLSFSSGPVALNPASSPLFGGPIAIALPSRRYS